MARYSRECVGVALTEDDKVEVKPAVAVGLAVMAVEVRRLMLSVGMRFGEQVLTYILLLFIVIFLKLTVSIDRADISLVFNDHGYEFPVVFFCWKLI